MSVDPEGSIFGASYKDIVGLIATVVTIIQFLSGSAVCLKYLKTRSTGETSGFSFACGFFSCNLWLMYGLLKHDYLVFVVNCIGCFLFFSYIFIYYRFSVKKTTINYQFLTICVLLIIFHLYLASEENLSVAIERTGLISCVVTLVFIASPLTLLLHVIRVKSTESLPFPIILTSFFVCTLWLIYGYLINDPFMEIPNGIGSLLALFQLSLFLYFPSSAGTSQYTKMRQVV